MVCQVVVSLKFAWNPSVRPFVGKVLSSTLMFSLQLVRCTCGSSDQVCLAESLWGVYQLSHISPQHQLN